MYFLTIDEFDIFAELIKTKKMGLIEGLEDAKIKDSDPKTKKFDFLLHLMSWDNSNSLPTFLKEKSNKMFEKLQSILKPNC